MRDEHIRSENCADVLLELRVSIVVQRPSFTSAGGRIVFRIPRREICLVSGLFFVSDMFFFLYRCKKKTFKVCSDPKPERMYQQTCRELNVKQPLSQCFFLCLERRQVLKRGVVV